MQEHRFKGFYFVKDGVLGLHIFVASFMNGHFESEKINLIFLYQIIDTCHIYFVMR